MVVVRAGRQENSQKGFETKGGYVHHLKAFADDLTVVDRSLESLKSSWARLKEGLEWCQLEVNKDKSRILHFKELPTACRVGLRAKKKKKKDRPKTFFSN